MTITYYRISKEEYVAICSLGAMLYKDSFERCGARDDYIIDARQTIPQALLLTSYDYVQKVNFKDKSK